MEDINIDEIIGSIQKSSEPDQMAKVEGSVPEKEEGSKSAAREPQRLGRGEMSAVAVARLMGLATSAEVKNLEGKLDLMTNKIALLTAKLEKVIAELSDGARGADIDRVEVTLSKIIELIKSSGAES